MYEITEDLRAIEELFNSAVDENGEPRELTEEEGRFLADCFTNSQEDFEKKFDDYGKFLANLKAQSEIADAERKAMKSEMDRLSTRAKVYTNRRDAVKNYLYFNMKNISLDKYKTALFSANIQQAPLSIKQMGASKNIPEQFLKPREISTTAIKAAIKDGSVKIVGDELFFNGEQLEGLTAERGEILVIR